MEPLVIRVTPDGTSSSQSAEDLLDELADEQDRRGCEGDAMPRLRRFVEDFPESARYLEAVYRLGDCHDEAGDHARARSYFRYVSARTGGDLGLGAGLRAAYALERLGRHRDAAAEYRAIYSRKGVPDDIRAGARLRRAICLFRGRNAKHARRELADGMRMFTTLESPPDSIRSAAAEAHFLSAEEIARAFGTVELAYPQEKLERGIGLKLARLADARDAYLDVTKLRDAEWSSAAAFRIGTLLEKTYADLKAVPPPAELDAAQKAYYASQLDLRLTPFRRQAFQQYLQVVALGERVGLENAWTAGSRARIAALESELKTRIMSPEEEPEDEPGEDRDEERADPPSDAADHDP